MDTERGTQPDPRRWWALTVLCLSLVIINLDNTILNVALPTLVRDLRATASQLEWIVDAYVLVFAGLLLTCGSFGDRFGRKRALGVGLTVFVIFSLLAARSASANQLIGARALMGIGAATIMPATLSILTNIFPPSERARAIGLWSAAAGLAIPAGPIAGGWLLERYSWGSIFYVNVPIAVGALIAAYFLIPESRDPRPARPDWSGAALSIAGLTALLYAIIEAPSRGWLSGQILLAFGLALVLLAAFVAWELRTSHPMLEMRLFADARFSAANAALTFLFFTLLGTTFFLTQYLQFSLRYSTFQAGLRMIPIALGIAIGAPLSARLIERFGTKRVVAAGLFIVALGISALSLVGRIDGYGVVAFAMAVGGLGMGLAMTPATDSVMDAVTLENAGVGSAMNDTTREIGGALGVAVLGSLLSTFFGTSMSGAVQGLPAESAASAKDSIGTALLVAGHLPGQAGQALLAAADHAFRHAMGISALVAAAVTLAGMVVVLLFLPAWAGEPGAEPSLTLDLPEEELSPARS